MKRIALLLSLLVLVSCGAPEIKHEAKTSEVQIVETPALEEKTSEKEVQKAPEKKPEIKKEEKPIVTPEEKTVAHPEPAPAQEEKEEKTLCTILVTCEKIFSKLDKLAEGKADLVPKDGVILSAVQMEFTEGESVFDVLKRCLAENDISLKYREDVIYKSVYVEGIGGIFEKDCGAYSGWMYKVNGTPPTCGISDYKIKEGDIIELYYSC